MISNIRPDHLSYSVEVDGRSFIRPRRMLRAIPLESSSPPSQATAQVSPSLPRRSARHDLSVSNEINHESADVHLDLSNYGFSFINLHWASFSTGLSSVLFVLISLGFIARCCYVRGPCQRQSRASHTELLRTIVHVTTKAISTNQQQQSGAYPGLFPSLQPSAVQHVSALPDVADHRLIFKPPVIPARGSTAYPVVRYTPAQSASGGLLGSSTTYGRRALTRDPRPHMLTYEDSHTLDVVPSAPPALEYLPEPRATGIHSLGR